MVQLLLLGAPRVARGGHVVPLTAAKAAALLALLALERMPQPRERIIDLLWPDSTAEAGRKNLRNTLWAIRRDLGDDALLTPGERLALAETIWCDVRELERTPDTAGPRYAPLLDGLSFSDAPDFEIWLAGERERLGQLALRGISMRIATLRAAGRWAELTEAAYAALALDPLQEPATRALMEALARQGERAAALRQYDLLRATLDRELGVVPLPETEALRAAILAGAIAPPAEPPRPRVTPVTSTPARAPFVGRAPERQVLYEELARAATGEPRVVLLTGEVGIGKTRLWQEWAAELAAPEGVRWDPVILETRCLDTTRALPYLPLATLLSEHPCTRRLFTPPSPVAPIWLTEVARLLPQIRTQLPDLPAPAQLPAEEERHRLFEALVQCLAALQASPLVVFIDDLHWADRATLDWLGYLVHRTMHAPLLLAAAYRPEDAPAPLVHLLAGWGRQGLSRRIVLPRLADDEALALVSALGSDPQLAQTLQRQSAGNPYFLTELCRAAPGELPPALADLVRARLAGLPAAALQVVQAGAVLEPDFDLPTLRRTAGRNEAETLDALDALLAGGVLRERGGRYGFAHPLVAAVVREELSGARRAFLHRRAAETREALEGGRLAQIAGRLLGHYTAAGDNERAAHYADMAARHALDLAAPVEAASFARQALALVPTPARRLALGDVLNLLGEQPAARAALEQAAVEFGAAGDQRGAAEACLHLAETFLGHGRAGDVLEWVDNGLRALGGNDDPALRAFAHFLQGAARLVSEHSLGEAEFHLAEAARLAAEHHILRVAGRARLELGNLRVQRGDPAGALAIFREMIAISRASGDQFQEVLGHNNAAYAAILAGDLPAAHDHVAAGLELAEARTLEVPRQWLYSTRGELAMAERQWDEAQGWFERGLAEARRQENLQQAANYHANLGLAARGRGDLDGALMQLEQARTQAARLTALHLQAEIELWLAELYLQRGERAAAAEALARADDLLAGGGRTRLLARARELRARL